MVTEKPKVLQFWNSEEEKKKWKTIESDLVTLICECGSLKSELTSKDEDVYQNNKILLLKLIEIKDTFDRVFLNLESKEKDMDKKTKIWMGNFRSICRLVERILKEEGVVPIEAPAGKAIPGLHRIVETVSSKELENDTILEEPEKGYLWHRKVLRKSIVKAVKNN